MKKLCTIRSCSPCSFNEGHRASSQALVHKNAKCCRHHNCNVNRVWFSQSVPCECYLNLVNMTMIDCTTLFFQRLPVVGTRFMNGLNAWMSIDAVSLSMLPQLTLLMKCQVHLLQFLLKWKSRLHSLKTRRSRCARDCCTAMKLTD